MAYVPNGFDIFSSQTENLTLPVVVVFKSYDILNSKQVSIRSYGGINKHI